MPIPDEIITLARHGFRILPVREGNKAPNLNGWPAQATTDEARLAEWGRQYPRGNWGVALGAGTGLCVVDVDAHHGGDFALEMLEAENEELPATPTVRTAHGGQHRYFKHVPGLLNDNTGKITVGVDFKTDGGQVVLPPSVLADGGCYEWTVPPPWAGGPDFAELPSWIVARLKPARKAPKPSPRTETAVYIGEGNRNDGLFRELCRLRELEGLSDTDLEARAYELNRTACTPPLPEHEVAKIATSVCRYTPGESLERPAESQMPANHTASLPTEQPGHEEKQGPKFIKSRQGTLVANAANITEALTALPELQGLVVYDEFNQQIDKTRVPVFGGEAGPWVSADDTRLAVWLQRRKLSVTPAQVADTVNAEAHNHKVNPVRDYLLGLKWDGTGRADTWAARLLGAVSKTGSETYVSAVGAKWLISAVARALEPGCKVDHMLILEGPQGIGKSTAISMLCPNQDWHTSDFQTLDKEASQNLRGKWVLEFSELQVLSRYQAETAKAFLSRQVDHYRAPYARRAEDYPRRCVFIGSTNADAYFTDETGNRRYWPITCTLINLAGIVEERDQLWAEAVVRYQSGEKWWLDAAQTDEAKAEQADREVRDEWLPLIEQFLYGRDRTFSGEIFEQVLKIDVGRWTPAESKRVGRCMAQLGWKNQVVRINGQARRGYVKGVTPVTPVTSSQENPKDIHATEGDTCYSTRYAQEQKNDGCNTCNTCNTTQKHTDDVYERIQYNIIGNTCNTRNERYTRYTDEITPEDLALADAVLRNVLGRKDEDN